jgi:hypothetical protein
MQPYDKVKNMSTSLIEAYINRIELESPDNQENDLAYVEHFRGRLNTFLELYIGASLYVAGHWEDSANRIHKQILLNEKMGYKDLDYITDMCEMFLELIEEETERLDYLENSSELEDLYETRYF